MPTNKEFTECIICSKPLGQATKDDRLMLCYECRKCQVCGKALGSHEILNAWDEWTEAFKIDNTQCMKPFILHLRCSLVNRPTGEQDPSLLVKQSYIDFLNEFRFLPDPELSPETNSKMAGLQAETYVHKLPFDSRYTYLCMLEAAVAHVSIAIKTDKKVMKQAADVREAKKFKEAAAQARVSSRATSKPETDEKEIILGAFMAENDIKERTVAMKILKDRSKAIQGLMNLGIPQDVATKHVDEDMRKRGQIK